MSGRAYVQRGDKKASAFIASEFKKKGLTHVKGKFFYKFPIPVNSIRETELVYNGKILKPGIDYLISASSPSIEANADMPFVPFDQLNLENAYDKIPAAQKYLVFDTFNARYSAETEIAYRQFCSDPSRKLLIRLSYEKLTWTGSTIQSKVCVITLRNAVFDRSVTAHFTLRVKASYDSSYTSRNVLGMVRGTHRPDSIILIGAHYDHLGRMGKDALFPGANDNASGIAMLLDLAGYFAGHPQKYSLVFVAFSGEEFGLVGSHFLSKHFPFQLSDIRFMLNLDLMANGADGVMVVNGTVHPDEFKALQSINQKQGYLPQIKQRGRAANSDHYWFSQAGVPAFFFYLMGPYPYYHDVNDKPEMVPFTNYCGAFLLFRDFVMELQKI
jgi:hypothetical protein